MCCEGVGHSYREEETAIASLVYVGEGSSHGRQRVEAQDEEAHISQEARPVASDDDETEAPGA